MVRGVERDALRVAALELPARWREPARGLADAEALLAGGPAADLVLLPELALTGYISAEAAGGDAADLRPFAEPLDGATTAALAKLARAHHVHLVGPLVLLEEDRCSNALVALGPDGALLATYRKRHPWYVETWATPGDQPLATLEVHGCIIALAICFDVHFLAEESARELEAADVLLFASAWVEAAPGEDARPALLSHLAQRFDLAIVNANWGHGTPRVLGQGGSRIVGPGGAFLATATGDARPHPQRIDATL